MTQYKLESWEDNGYQDSDWYLAVWDSERRAVVLREVGTTRCAAGCNVEGFGFELPTLEVVREACAWLAEAIYQRIRAAELADVLEPQAAADRVDLRLSRNVRHKGEVLPAGAVGRVFWSGAYGQFYAKGYNRPDRGNTRVGLELQDGRRVFVALAACRLDREPMQDSELRARAERLSLDCKFAPALTKHYAWDSFNWAAPLARQLEMAAEVAA